MPISVPTEIDQVTTEWLGSALAEGGLPGARVSEVSTERIAEGVGFIGQLHRISIQYDAAPEDAPKSLIAKMPTNEAGGRMVGSMMRLYEREHGFYRHLAGECPVPTARCFYNGGDIEEGDYCLLLEDLSHLEPGDQLRACTLDETTEMLGIMARIHARWCGARAKAHTWLPAIDDQSAMVMLSMFDDSYPVAMERYGHLIPEYMHDWAPRFAPVAPAWVTNFAAQPSTIIHGDFRTDNFMFGSDSTSKLLDWQVVAHAPGAYDVYYFLGLSADADMVSDNLDSLLDLYLSEYRANGGTPPDKETLLDQMRGVGMWLTTLGMVSMSQLDPTNDRGEKLFLAMWERGLQLAERIDLSPVVP